MRNRGRRFSLRALAVLIGVGFSACGDDDGGRGSESKADPANPAAGTYSGKTAQGQRVTLTVAGGAVRRATVRLKGSGAVIQGSRPCAALVRFTKGDGSEIGDDGSFELGPVRKRTKKARVTSRSSATLQGRFTDRGGVRGTVDYRARTTFVMPAETLFELEGSQVTTPAQKLTTRCEGRPVKFSARGR